MRDDANNRTVPSPWKHVIEKADPRGDLYFFHFVFIYQSNGRLDFPVPLTNHISIGNVQN